MWLFMVACDRRSDVVTSVGVSDAQATATFGSDASIDAADTVRDGVRFTAVTGHARHTHGGEPAHVSSARVDFTNEGATHRLRVAAVDFLSDHGGDCHGLATTFRKHLEPSGLRFADDEGYAPNGEVVVAPASRGQLEVYFEPADAYYTYCDTFAFRVQLLVDATPKVVVVELQVTRVEPMRRP